MNLNKNFLTEVIKYLINRGVTLTDVLDTFNEHFYTSDNAIKHEHEKHDEVRKPITDIDLLLCGRSVEESSTPCTAVDSLKNMPTEIKRGTINNVIEEPLLPKYTMTESDKISLESVSLSPETLNKVFDITDIDSLLCGKSVEESSTPCQKVEKKAEKPVNKSLIDYPKNIKNHGNGVSPARKALFDVINGKTVIEHLKENGITYSNFDNRIRKKWSVADACTTPLASWGKGKRKRVIEEPGEHKAVIVPDTNVISLEPDKIIGTKYNTVIFDNDIPAENTAENVTIEPQTKTDTDTRVNDTNANSDAIHEDKDDYIEKALKKFITSTTGIEFEESKKDKKPKETKSDLTVLEVCQKMNVTTHELKEMISTGDFPQPDCDKKWSVKLLKKEGII